MSEELVQKTIKPAVEFIKKIKSGSRVTIIHAHDNDSMCSAAIIFRLLKKIYNIESKLVVSEFNFRITEKSFAEIEKTNPEFVIVLDIADIPKEVEKFLEKYKVLVIDHHGPSEYKKFSYSNPMLHDSSSYIPTTYLSYRIFKSFLEAKEILWIAGIGTLADHGVTQNTDLFDEIKKFEQELVDGIEFVDEKLFDLSLLGAITKIFDSASIVKNISGVKLAVKILIETKSYKNVLATKTAEIKQIVSWYEEMKKEFDRLVKDFKKNKKESGKFLIYEIKSKFNLKSSLAGYIQQFYKNKILVVYQSDGGFYAVSFRRGIEAKDDLRKIAKNSVKGIENSSAGGHIPASAARIPKVSLGKFLVNLKSY